MLNGRPLCLLVDPSAWGQRAEKFQHRGSKLRRRCVRLPPSFGRGRQEPALILTAKYATNNPAWVTDNSTDIVVLAPYSKGLEYVLASLHDQGIISAERIAVQNLTH